MTGKVILWRFVLNEASEIIHKSTCHDKILVKNVIFSNEPRYASYFSIEFMKIYVATKYVELPPGILKEIFDKKKSSLSCCFEN